MLTFAPLLAEAVALSPRVWFYAGFIAVVIFLLLFDLLVLHRKAHALGMKEAIGWSIFWISLGLSFTAAIYFIYDHHWLGFGMDVMQLGGERRNVGGAEAARLYLTAYIVEESLSMDNVFVMAMIFGYFGIPAQYQHRVLFWGIATAIVLRGIMIAAGATLIHQFHWIIYVFGVFLIFTAIKMALTKEHGPDPEKNFAVRLVRKLVPVTKEYDGQHFFTRNSTQFPGVLAATPLFLALIMIETADVLFAVDSIPAVFGITADPFIVFTSNIFAIMGLRALYFCLAALIATFRYLKPALIGILAFVGVKMLLFETPWKIGSVTSLLVVLGALTLSIIASIVIPAAAEPAHEETKKPTD